MEYQKYQEDPCDKQSIQYCLCCQVVLQKPLDAYVDSRQTNCKLTDDLDLLLM